MPLKLSTKGSVLYKINTCDAQNAPDMLLTNVCIINKFHFSKKQLSEPILPLLICGSLRRLYFSII